MKLITHVVAIVVISLASLQAFAYEIGGAYASLQSCQYGQWGYEYGNIGTYLANGRTYQVFFGGNWCEH